MTASGVTAADSSAGTAAVAGPSASNATLSKDSFLRLLVAQIKNQNPLNPADGVQFLTQLAQFSELEQLLSIREDVGAIRKAAASQSAPADPQAAKKSD